MLFKGLRTINNDRFTKVKTMQTANETAILVATILRRSGQTRARISDKTIRLLAKRKRLRKAFLVDLDQAAEDFGVLFCELDTGAYGVFSMTSLEGAKTVTAKKFLSDVELIALKKGKLSFSALLDELEPENYDSSDE